MKSKIIIAGILALLLLVGAVSAQRITDTLSQAVAVSYCSGAYDLKATYIGEGKVRFNLNNESSPSLVYHDLFEFKDGSSIYVREILEEEAAEGPDKVSIRFYPEKCVVSETETINITEATKEEINETTEEAVQMNETEEIIVPDIAPIQEVQEKEPSFFEKIMNWIRNLLRI